MTFDIAARFAAVYRDFVNEGEPTSGTRHVPKSEIRELGEYLASAVSPGTIYVDAPEFDVGSGTQGLVDAIAEAKYRGGARIELTQRKIKVRTGTALIDFDNVCISSAYGTEIVADTDFPAANKSMFSVAGGGKGVALTTLAASVEDPRNVFDIDVADSAPFSAGDTILIAARSASANYFYGIDGRPGFSPVFYAETVRLKDVSAGNLQLAAALRYPYVVDTGVVVDVYKLDLLSNIRFSGLRGVGLGFGPDGEWNDLVNQSFITAAYVEGLSVADVSARRFKSFAVLMQNVRGSYLTNVDAIGIDYTDPYAAGETDNGHGGVSWHSSEDGIWDGGNVENVRHVTDLATSGGAVTNNITVASVVADGQTACVFGGHLCDNHHMYGCRAERGGAYMRGKNWWVANCKFEVSGPLSDDTGEGMDSAGGIVAGAGYTGVEYPENLDMGVCGVSDSYFRCAIGIYLRNSCSSLVVSNNIFDCSGSAFAAYGKVFKNHKFTGNQIDLSRHLPGANYGLVYGFSDIPMLEVLFNISADDNTVINGTAAYRIRGTKSPNSPADGLIFTNTKMVNIDSDASAIAGFSEGYFGDNVKVKDVEVLGSEPFNIVNLDDDLGYFSRRPEVSGYSVWEPRTIGYGGSVPSAARTTTLIGDRFFRTSDRTDHITTVSGTLGTLSGVTGSIASGTPNLTLAGGGDRDVTVGMILSVAGAGVASAALVARVKSVTLSPGTATATACVLDTNASTTVAGAGVTYQAPTVT
ncbi:hypothetical protein [Reyranella sp.]|uniref:hypothetical protein n=1 Tax=Reyranella sp. TaxID=1929291 RepID=UPI003D09DAFB